MESEPDLSNTATIHPKHAAMLRRLSHRNTTKPSHSDTFESTPSFLSLFINSKNSIQSSLSTLSSKSDVASVSDDIASLEKLVAQASSFLPSFELQNCLKTISLLKTELNSGSLKIVRKKAFSFKNKKPVSDTIPESETPVLDFPNSRSLVPELPGFRDRKNEFLGSENASKTTSSFKNKIPITDLKQDSDTHILESTKSAFLIPESPKNEVLSTKFSGSDETHVLESPNSTFLIPESPGFRDRENLVLFKEFLGLEIGEFVLSGLDSCEVRLKGCFRALFVNKLKNCKVYCGPVSGSVLIEEVEDCVFVLASHQIRIHNAKRCDFYLRVRSRPIIEDCEGVRFAPYCLGYEGIERDLGEVNLDEENGNWENVDDFKWLKGFQSPNWMVLPESEQIGEVTISDLDK